MMDPREVTDVRLELLLLQPLSSSLSEATKKNPQTAEDRIASTESTPQHLTLEPTSCIDASHAPRSHLVESEFCLRPSSLWFQNLFTSISRA